MGKSENKNWQKIVEKSARRIGTESVTFSDVFHDLWKNGISPEEMPPLEKIEGYIPSKLKYNG